MHADDLEVLGLRDKVAALTNDPSLCLNFLSGGQQPLTDLRRPDQPPQFTGRPLASVYSPDDLCSTGESKSCMAMQHFCEIIFHDVVHQDYWVQIPI